MTTIIYCDTPEVAQTFLHKLRKEGNNQSIRMVSPNNFNGDCEPHASEVYAVNVSDKQADALTEAYAADDVGIDVERLDFASVSETCGGPEVEPRKRRTKAEMKASKRKPTDQDTEPNEESDDE